MRSDLIRVTKPGWVRIVNPEPLIVLGKTYRYGDVLLIRPGGVIRILFHSRPRALAHYEAPDPPQEHLDCPTDTLLFDTLEDLRLLANGSLGYETRPEPEISGVIDPAPTPPCRIFTGQQARVPASRLVRRARPPPVEIDSQRGGPYREEITTTTFQSESSWDWLRPGGVLTVMEEQGPHVKVFYTPNSAQVGDQCEKDAWFWLPSIDFILMEITFQTYRTLEGLERSEIIRILRSS